MTFGEAFAKLAGSKFRSRFMLSAVKRNMDFVDALLAAGGFLESWQKDLLGTIRVLYAQQKEMFDLSAVSGVVYEDAVKRAVSMQVDGLVIKVISLDDLIVNKRAHL